MYSGYFVAIVSAPAIISAPPSRIRQGEGFCWAVRSLVSCLSSFHPETH
jgi:hypothetical protein